MLEMLSLTVKEPLPPRFTLPLPESISPAARLRGPIPPYAIEPWQLTGSVIDPQPTKPCPGASASVVPAVWTSPSDE